MTLLDHCRDNCFRYDERCIQVYVDYLTELICGHLGHGDSLDDTCVVHQDIDGTYFLLDLSYHSVNCFFVGNVTYIAVSLDAFLSVCCDSLVYQLLLDIVEADGSTALSVCGSDSEANTVRCAGNQCYLTFQ